MVGYKCRIYNQHLKLIPEMSQYNWSKTTIWPGEPASFNSLSHSHQLIFQSTLSGRIKQPCCAAFPDCSFFFVFCILKMFSYRIICLLYSVWFSCDTSADKRRRLRPQYSLPLWIIRCALICGRSKQSLYEQL